MNSNQLTREELNQLREISIHKILGIRQTGRLIQMRCPLPNHNDSTPSFTLYPDGGFKCFGCGASGHNAIDFVKQLGYSFMDCCEELLRYI